jgi:hypothetical protein
MVQNSDANWTYHLLPSVYNAPSHKEDMGRKFKVSSTVRIKTFSPDWCYKPRLKGPPTTTCDLGHVEDL